GSALVYSTYLGGTLFDSGLGIAVDAGGNAYVTGRTQSPDFPTTPGAFQTTFRSGPLGRFDAFVTKIDPTGSTLVYSTYLAGAGIGGIRGDAFVVKIAGIAPPPRPTTGKVTGGGSVDVAGGIATFGFNVKRQAADGPIDGQLQYVNHATKTKVHSVALDSFTI